MKNIQATHFLQLIHLDYLRDEVTESGKDVHLLIITDHFMWYTEAVVTSLHTAKFRAQALWDTFMVNYGISESIVSDQSQNFESNFMAELCKLPK